MSSNEIPKIHEKSKKYESLFGKLDKDQWEKNKYFAQEYNDGKYKTKTDWSLFFQKKL